MDKAILSVETLIETIEYLVTWAILYDKEPKYLIINRHLFEDLSRKDPTLLDRPEFKTEIRATVNKITGYKSTHHKKLILDLDLDEDEPAVRLLDRESGW